jgi:hypothetical protein
MSQVRVHPSPAETNASARSSPATATFAQDNDKCFTKQLSFGAGDEFFHGMLSYRVNSEGPNGNNLALLLWDSCCQSGISSRQNSKADEAIQRSIDAVNQFGIWPRVFPRPSSSGVRPSSSGVRIFLDQKNLRPGFDWKGTGNRADGGFLGALSSSLTLVPLLSATPARFKIMKTTGSDGRFQFKERGNFAIQEPLDIFCESVGESSSGNNETKHLLCTDFRSSDNSFILKSVGGEEWKPESIENASFWTSRYILSSNGSGPKGSVSEMLTLMQIEEDLSFHVKRSSGFVTTLEVVELSDHVFFKTEKILLQLDQNSEKLHEFAIEAVEVQGSKIGEIKSVIQVNCGENLRPSEASDSTIRGKTKAIDRKDNVLIEFMLARALYMLLAADTNPHPCKIILPVFVDDLSVIMGTSKCLSTNVSLESAKEVKECLLQILKKDAISLAEEQKLINVSIKDVVLFFSNLQGCQLSKGEIRSLSMEAKAELVCSSILSTVGIEAELYAREQYVSNNPLAHELLSFIKQQDIGHIERSLVKFDVSSVKTFSKLSSESIKSIAEDSLVISKKSLVRETADITCAIDAAKDSPYILPVSRRLAIFEDKDASFMTIIYSTFAMEQGLTKALFGIWFFVILGGASVFAAVLQFRREEFGYATVNLARALTSCFMLIIIHVFKSIRYARFALFFGYLLMGLASFASVTIDQLVDGEIISGHSNFCALNFHESKMQLCLQYMYVVHYWQGLFYLIVAPYILTKQEWVWRGWNIGTSVYFSLNLSYMVLLGHAGFGDYLPSVALPCLLLITEFLKFYGTLQAIRSTQKGKQKLTEAWDNIYKNHENDLKEIAKFVSDKCSRTFAILDRSKDLGKWKVRARTEPPQIRQPVSDFDELYLRAITFNDSFQMWIGSIFLEPENRRSFVYEMTPQENLQAAEAATATEATEAAEKERKNKTPLNGEAIRGPVKRPHRAIAKVGKSFYSTIVSS